MALPPVAPDTATARLLSWSCTPPLVSAGAHSGEGVDGDGLEREPEVEQRPALASDADAEAGHGDGGCRVTVLPVSLTSPTATPATGGRGSIHESSASSHTVTSPVVSCTR